MGEKRDGVNTPNNAQSSQTRNVQEGSMKTHRSINLLRVLHKGAADSRFKFTVHCMLLQTLLLKIYHWPLQLAHYPKYPDSDAVSTRRAIL